MDGNKIENVKIAVKTFVKEYFKNDKTGMGPLLIFFNDENYVIDESNESKCLEYIEKYC